MASSLDNYRQKWQQLNGREQSLVVAMSLIIVIFLFYSLIWQPLNNNLIKSTKKLERQQKLLTWVQNKTSQYIQVRSLGNRASGSLTGIINRTSRPQKITITRMQPQGDDLQVWVEEVPFDKLLSWLEQLVNKEGLIIKAIDISNTEQVGIVRVRRLQLGKS